MKKPLCTVLIPFDATGEERFAMLKKLAEQLGYDAFRVAQYYSSGVILEEIVRSIRDAYLIIADLTGCNPNVYYELGIAHTLGKRVFVTAEDPDAARIGVENMTIHKLDSTPAGRNRLLHELNAFVDTPGLLSPIGLYTGGLAVAGQRLLTRRIGSFLIDALILSVIAAPVSYFALPGLVAAALTVVAIVAYFAVTTALFGGSLGQRWLGLEVLRLDRSKPTILQNLLRPVAVSISVFSLGTGFLWAAKRPRYQALQDRITSTLVVRRRPRAELQPFHHGQV
jgi:uncharacterized RDD family membrane protein YckC